MEAKELERIQELSQKVDEAGGKLDVLTPDEVGELERLLRKRTGKEEFGHPIYGED